MIPLLPMAELFSTELMLAFVASLGLGALLGWDIRTGDAARKPVARQAALAAIAGAGCVVTFALAAGESAMSNALLVALIAASVVSLSVMAVRALLTPLKMRGRLADLATSAAFAATLGASLGLGLAHVAGVIVPAALLFLNLMRWNAAPATEPEAKLG